MVPTKKGQQPEGKTEQRFRTIIKAERGARLPKSNSLNHAPRENDSGEEEGGNDNDDDRKRERRAVWWWEDRGKKRLIKDEGENWAERAESEDRGAGVSF